MWLKSRTVWTQEVVSTVEFSGLSPGQNYCVVANFSFPTFSMAASPQSAPKCVETVIKSGKNTRTKSSFIFLINSKDCVAFLVFFNNYRKHTVYFIAHYLYIKKIIHSSPEKIPTSSDTFSLSWDFWIPKEYIILPVISLPCSPVPVGGWPPGRILIRFLMCFYSKLPPTDGRFSQPLSKSELSHWRKSFWPFVARTSFVWSWSESQEHTDLNLMNTHRWGLEPEGTRLWLWLHLEILSTN